MAIRSGEYSNGRTAVAAVLLFVFLSGCSARIDLDDEGPGEEKVTICHNGKKTLSVSRAALEAHLKHGDTLGPCLRKPCHQKRK